MAIGLFLATAGVAAWLGTVVAFAATIEQATQGADFAAGLRGIVVAVLVATVARFMTPRFLAKPAPLWALGVASAVSYCIAFQLTGTQVAFADLVASHPAGRFFLDAIVWFMGTSLGIWWGRGSTDEPIIESQVVNQHRVGR